MAQQWYFIVSNIVDWSLIRKQQLLFVLPSFLLYPLKHRSSCTDFAWNFILCHKKTQPLMVLSKSQSVRLTAQGKYFQRDCSMRDSNVLLSHNGLKSLTQVNLVFSWAVTVGLFLRIGKHLDFSVHKGTKWSVSALRKTLPTIL